jgi:hypothetical protein
MKATKFYSLKEIKGNAKDFHRNRKTGTYNKRGVYFWGFTLRYDSELPKTKDEFVIYYIGKDEKSIIRRIMEEVTQLIFGGYGTIIDYNWLIKNPHKAKIFDKQESDKKGTKTLDREVLYKSDGLHVLYDFFYSSKIQPTIDWMRERLIFAWIDVDKNDDISDLEMEFHDIVKTNILGIGRKKKFIHKNNEFSNIDWSSNKILKEWFEQVKKNITSP